MELLQKPQRKPFPVTRIESTVYRTTRVPINLQDCLEMITQVGLEIQDITTQLAERKTKGITSNNTVEHWSYIEWREKALSAKKYKTRQLQLLKCWRTRYYPQWNKQADYVTRLKTENIELRAKVAELEAIIKSHLN